MLKLGLTLKLMLPELPREVYIHIASLADTETRRAMGFPIDNCLKFRLKPNKLDPSWKEFVPKTVQSEKFTYYEDTNTLVYYEFVGYGSVYYEYITGIVPEPEQWEKGFCGWKLLQGSRQRGVVLDDTHINEYDLEMNVSNIMTVGFPVIVSGSY